MEPPSPTQPDFITWLKTEIASKGLSEDEFTQQSGLTLQEIEENLYDEYHRISLSILSIVRVARVLKVDFRTVLLAIEINPHQDPNESS